MRRRGRGVPSAFLDHLVVVAPTLAAGSDYVENALGVRPQPGGEHVRMGTHNTLLRLGSAMYLEVIAINPGAADPGRPRWFGLDDLAPDAPPRLAAWAARCDNIEAAVTASPIAFGPIEPMSRGDLEWLITIPDDGRLILDGVLPLLIQWTRGSHPVGRLADQGCKLTRLQLSHPRGDRVEAALGAIGLNGGLLHCAKCPDSGATLTAEIETPKGLRLLGGRGGIRNQTP